MIVNHNFQGICTKPKEILGSFDLDGFSSKIPFHSQSIEEIKLDFTISKIYFLFL